MNYIYSKEKIFAVKIDTISKIGYFNGIITNYSDYVESIKSDGRLYRRDKIEYNKKLKQIIPYGIIVSDELILSYKRSQDNREKRLSGMYSIGIGGHITEHDMSFSDFISACLKREIQEEIEIDYKHKSDIVAVLNDDSNNVSSVHFGIIFLIRVDLPLVKEKEMGIKNCRFISRNSIEKNFERYEKWSQLCIKDFNRILS